MRSTSSCWAANGKRWSMNGNAGSWPIMMGDTQFRPDDDRRNVPRTYLVERLAVALGGRSAEELALGDITTGAENDLKEASQLARRMVSEWGMGEQTGPVVFDLSDGSPYL